MVTFLNLSCSGSFTFMIFYWWVGCFLLCILHRPGVANGAIGVGKVDSISQQTSLGMRSTIPRTDQDNNSLLNDRRDRPIGSDKERVNIRAVNK